MSDLIKQYRFLEAGELIQEGDEWRAYDNSGNWGNYKL